MAAPGVTPPSLPEQYWPLGAMHWHLTLDGFDETIPFTEVTGLATENSVVEYRASGSMGNVVYKLRGNQSVNNLMLRRGLCQDRSLHEWRARIETMGLFMNRKNGSLMFLGYEHNSPVIQVQYDFLNAWPNKFIGPEASADATGHAVESLELVIDALHRVV